MASLDPKTQTIIASGMRKKTRGKMWLAYLRFPVGYYDSRVVTDTDFLRDFVNVMP